MESQQSKDVIANGAEPAVSAASMESFVEALFQIAERIECQEQRLRHSLNLAARDGNLPLVQQILKEWDGLAERD